MFGAEPFVDKDGTDYYSYKYWIGFGIIINSVLTYGAEKCIVNCLTKRYDEKVKQKKFAEFQREMLEYKDISDKDVSIESEILEAEKKK